MIRLILPLVLICLFTSVHAQSILSRVTFPIDEHQTRQTLAKAGIDLSHGHGSSRTSFTTEIETYQFKRLDEVGIRYTVDIQDLNVYRKELQQNATRENFLECQDHLFDERVPNNFELGSLGGFFSYSEVLDHLDAMEIYYPNLITARAPIGNFKTWENNSIFWVKISDNAGVNENEPEVLYTGVHHSREFITVSQMIYYMWYVLENYDKDTLVRQMVNQTELYFVPVINPDGYMYNAAGYDEEDDVFTRNFRKNLRDNDEDGSFDPEIDGVDLNRNYAYEWAYDDEGSSGFFGSDTYRGPAPFSEPETQAIEYFCNTHEFQFALNYHSYGNVLIHPWGFNDASTADSILFSNYGELLTKLNRFVYGRGSETVGYVTNGDSDDWMYGELGIYSMTPEVGDPDDGFYPIRQRIIPLCQSTLNLNILAARLVNSLIVITDEAPKFIQAGVNPLDLGFNRYGLLEGEVLISFKGLSNNILEVPSPFILDLNQFEPQERNLTLTVDDQIPYGSEIEIEIICQQGNYTFRDTLTKIRADIKSIISDEGDLSQWDISAGPNWGVTNESFKSGPVSITDSPHGPYIANANESIVLVESIDLNNTISAYAQYWCKWDLEDYYDYIVFQVSTDGENWDNLCGEQSNLGSIFQLYEEPVYDGKQHHWVFENVDLSAYIGQVIQLRFLLVTDGFVHHDGFYFDNFKVVTVKEQESVATPTIPSSAFSVYPNPAGNYFTLELPTLTKPTIVVFNSTGQLVYQSKEVTSTTFRIESANWPAGLYRFQVLSGGAPVHSGNVSILR